MSNTNDERSPGITRSVLGRIIAVTLFVGLGTFAVAQSVIGNKPTAGEDVASLNVDDGGAATSIQKHLPDKAPAQPPASATFGATTETPKVNSFSPPPISTSFGGNKTTPSTGSTGAVRPISFPKQPAITTPSSGSFQAKPTKPANEFPKLQPINGFGSNNVNTLKPPTTQTPLNERPETKLPSASSLTKSVTNQFENARQEAEGTVNSIKHKISDATSNVAKRAENGLRNQNENFSGARPASRGSDANVGFAPQNNNPVQNSIPHNFVPANNTYSPSPPVAAFDTSRDLKPIASQGFPDVPQNPSDAIKPNLPSINRPIQSTSPPISARQPITPPATKQPKSRGNLGESTLAPVRAQNRQPATQVASASTLLTKSTPGDRQLEGIQAPSVTIEKIAPREIQVNQPADFQLIVKNVGRITASDVRVFDEIPVGTQLIQATPQPNRGTGSQVNWDLGELKPGQEKRIKIQLNPTRPGEIGSVAHVTFSTQAAMRTRVTKPVLSVQHKSEPRVLIGDTVILDIVVKNEGDGPATNVLIQEDLPEQLEFDDGFRELEYAIGTLAPGQSKNVRLSLKAAQIGTFRNILIAHAEGGLQAQHAIDMEVIAPKLVVSGDGPNRRFLKRQTKHQFSVRNNGTANATNVELICRLPNGLQFVSANNRGKYDSNTHAVYWSLAEISPDVAASVEMETIPIETGNQNIAFEAVADLDQKANLDRSLVVEHLVDLFFDIDDIVDPIEIGSTTSYRVRVVNQGTKTATNVQLQVEFSNGIQPSSVDGNVTSEIRGQQVDFAPITNLNPGDEIAFTIDGKGVSAGDHRVIVNLGTDGRETNVAKQETTRVYNDR